MRGQDATQRRGERQTPGGWSCLGPQHQPLLLARPGCILPLGAGRVGQECGARALRPLPAALTLQKVETPSPITATEGRRCEGDLCPVHPAVRGHPRPAAPSGPHKHLQTTRSLPRKSAWSPGKAELGESPRGQAGPIHHSTSRRQRRMCAAPVGIRAGIFPLASARGWPGPGMLLLRLAGGCGLLGHGRDPREFQDHLGQSWESPSCSCPAKARADGQTQGCRRWKPHPMAGSRKAIIRDASGSPAQADLGCPSTAPGDASEMPNARSSPGCRQPQHLCGGASSQPSRSSQPPCLPGLELLPHPGRRFLQRATGQQPPAPRGAAGQRQ